MKAKTQIIVGAIGGIIVSIVGVLIIESAVPLQTAPLAPPQKVLDAVICRDGNHCEPATIYVKRNNIHNP